MKRNDMTDEELAALIDRMTAGDENAQSGTAFSLDDMEVIGATRKAVSLEKKPSRINFPRFKATFGRQRPERQSRPGTFWTAGRIAMVPGLCAAALVCVLLLTPASGPYDGCALGRGAISDNAIDSLFQAGDYPAALDAVNAEIEDRSEGLPRIEFFDRFLPEQKRYEVSAARAEIYELQWKRIEILSARGDDAALQPLLRQYVLTDGHHRHEAEEMLNR